MHVYVISQIGSQVLTMYNIIDGETKWKKAYVSALAGLGIPKRESARIYAS